MPLTFKATSYEAQLKPGLYRGRLTAIEERENDQGGYLIWRFTVDKDDDHKAEVSVLSSPKFSPSAKARKFAEGILGRAIQKGEELAPASLYGKPCQLLVSMAALDDGGSRNIIEQVLPLDPAMNEDDVPF
jgi:hypothetical protein